MFDLFRSRDKVVRLMLGGILVVVSLSMLTYLVPSFNTGSSATDQVVAEVGDDVITVPMVTKLVQAATRQSRIPQGMLQRWVPSVVDGMIIQRAMAYEAERLGFRVNDEEVREGIKSRLPQLFPDGQFAGVQAYADFLAQQNMTTQEFESELRRLLLIERFQNVALEGTVVTQAEIEQEFRQKSEKIKVEYVRVTADKYKAEAQPSVTELQDYFKANAAKYQTGEKRNLAILVADPAKIEASLTATDAELQQVYNQNKEAFRTPERVRVRHILLKTTGKPAADEPKIKAQAEDVLKQLKSGAEFGALAKKYSEDTSSANNPKGAGELTDWVARGQMVKPFEEAAFTLKPNQLSDLVKTEYGYHIVQVLAHEDARLRPFDEVKADLASQYKKIRVNNILQAVSDRVPADLKKDPSHPEKVAAQYNMELFRENGVAQGQTLPEIGASPDFEQAISGLKTGEASAAVTVQSNKLAVAVLTGVVPSRTNTFEEVQGQIRDSMVQARSNAALQRHGQELAAAAKQAGGLAAAAKAAGLEVKTSEEFTRSGTITGIGPATYLAEAFGKPDGTVVGPLNLPDGTLIARVVARSQADLSQLAAQRSQIRDEIKSRKAKDRETLFEEGVRDAMKKSGKLKVHESVIQRLINSYGSAS
jgi:peptidyl-prolyl cis-trans isomerase D